MSSPAGRLAILVGGGPAPGINSAISAVAIEARNAGLSVLGIHDGFEHLIEGRTDQVRELTIEAVSRIHFAAMHARAIAAGTACLIIRSLKQKLDRFGDAPPGRPAYYHFRN